MAEMTPADVAAVTHNGFGNGYGYGYGAGEWIWIVVLFALFGGGFGWGNRGYGYDNSALTRSDLQQGFDNQTIQNRLDSIGNKLTSIGNGICDSTYALNNSIMQTSNMTQRDILNSASNLGAAVSENRFTIKDCCCTTNRNIDAVRYENAKNTCEIVRAIEKDGEETRKLIVANQLQDLRDKVTEKDQQLQTANFQLSQQAQSANLINTLRPCPIPAYVTCSPYQSALYASNGSCGCGGY